MAEKKKKIPEKVTFFIDCSALKDMFEGKNKGKSDDLLKLLKRHKEEGIKTNVKTTLSSFLRAIWLADPNVSINKIQKALSFLEIGFSVADFKNEKAVRDEVILILRMVTKFSKRNKNVK